MTAPLDISLTGRASEKPVPQFIKLILHEAVMDKADEIVFALDVSQETKFRDEKEKLVQRGKVEEAFSLNPPKTFSISFKSGDRQNNLAPAPGDIFEPCMQILLNAAEIA